MSSPDPIAAATDTTSVRLERTLSAPTERVWQMWTVAEHFASWYGPSGASIPFIELEATVGGRRHFRMEVPTPDGAHQMWLVGEHRTVEPTSLLVYTESMSNEDGDVVEPASIGMPADHPAVTEVTVQLTPLDDGGTQLVVVHAGIPAGSPGEMGWNMALDTLAELL